MTALRAIVVDDEQTGIDSLKKVITEFIPDVKVVAESAKAGLAIELIENYKPEIVFLDINMPEMTGFDLLEKLSWKNFNLVFVTAHEEYGLKALKNNAMDYLLKPVDHNDLRTTVDRIKNKIKNSDAVTSMVRYASLINELNYSVGKGRLLVNLKSGIEPVELENVIYLESKSNYTQIHLENLSAHLIPKTLREFEEQFRLGNPNFMRVHHSFIINIHKVARYVKSEEIIIMTDNTRIPLSKSKKQSFYTWLNM